MQITTILAVYAYFFLLCPIPIINKSAGFYVRYFYQKQRLEKSCLAVLASFLRHCKEAP